MPPQAELSGPPRFDHVFAVVSADAFAAVGACELLTSEAFGRFAVRETESTLIGRYRPMRIIGEHTLIELFQDRIGEGEFAAVSCGLVFSFARVGDCEAARRRLSEAAIPFQAETLLRKRPSEGGLGLFYHSTRPQVGGPLALFLSEVTADYMNYLGAPIGPDGRFDRASYHAASLGRPHSPNAILRDVVGATLRLTPARAARVAQVMALMGYAVAATPGEVRLTDGDVGIRLLTEPDGCAEGLREVWMRVSAGQPHYHFDFGVTSALELSPGGPDDPRAVWRFNLGQN